MPGTFLAGTWDGLLSTTLANYRDTFADNLSKSYLLMYWLTTQGRKMTIDGGESIVIQLMYGKNQTIKSYEGYEVLDVTPQEGLTAAKFSWKQVAGSVSISRKEKRQNSGEGRIINLLESKITQAEISMREELNRMMYSDGLGNNNKDIGGLDLLNEDGTAYGTCGGIDAAVDTWWQNKWQGGVGAAGKTKLRNVYNSCSRGNEHPNIIIMTQALFEAFEESQIGIQRFNDTSNINVGFETMKYKGALVGYDEQCPSGTVHLLNSNYLNFVVDSETDLITTDFVRPENQDAETAQILLMANMVVSNRARQGRLDGVTAFTS